MMAFVKVLLLIVALVTAFTFAVLLRNNANLLEPPGVVQRLKIFLTTNVAETSDDNPLPELRTPVFHASAEALYQRVINAAANLGWEVVSHDTENQQAHFIERSQLFLFEDDIIVQVKFLSPDESSLHVISSSRVGNADFAANSDHIQSLIHKIQN